MAQILNSDTGLSVREKLNATGLRKNNLAAGAAPVAADDSVAGYEVGSLWGYGGSLYVCNSAGAGAAVWRRLLSDAAGVIALLTTTEAAAGAEFTALAGLIASYVAAGGEPIEPATAEDIRSRDEADVYYTPSGVEAAWASVSLPPTAGVIPVDGATFLRGHSTISANCTSTPANLDGEKRFHTITASGGAFTYTPDVDRKPGFDGLPGYLILDGDTVVLSYYAAGGATYCELEAYAGDRNQEVVLTPAANAITIAAAAIPARFRTPPLTANLTINAGALTGRKIGGRIVGGGANRTVTVAGFEQTNGGGTFSVPAGKTVTIEVEQQGSDQIISVLRTSD